MSIASIIAAAMLLSIAPPPAKYAASPPQYDQMMMLRIAAAYRFYDSSNATFCARAAIGVREHVLADHRAWYESPAADAYKDTLDDFDHVASGYDAACRWLDSQETQATIDGLTTVWYESQRDGYLADLREALATAKCEIAWDFLGAAPVSKAPARLVRGTIARLSGGTC
jgi:hypothetical protein